MQERAKCIKTHWKYLCQYQDRTECSHSSVTSLWVPVVWHWPSRQTEIWTVLSLSIQHPGWQQSHSEGWEMVSCRTGWGAFGHLIVLNVLYWNVPRTKQDGCSSSWPAAGPRTPRLLPSGTSCHWHGYATSFLTSSCILLACLPHSSTTTILDPLCSAAGKRVCRSRAAVALPDPVTPLKLPRNC